MERTECGPACLTMVLRFHGCRVSLSKVRPKRPGKASRWSPQPSCCTA
ncbi:MAG: hypothetical protein K6U03_04920 [Firmicutes bacterium]|nr:hypothetical protein [Bacillota bacterium]